jgi:hypothetical protein
MPVRKIKVERPSNTRTNNEVVIYVGEVNQGGNYEVLKLTEAEAAILMSKLESSLYK